MLPLTRPRLARFFAGPTRIVNGIIEIYFGFSNKSYVLYVSMWFCILLKNNLLHKNVNGGKKQSNSDSDLSEASFLAMTTE